MQVFSSVSDPFVSNMFPLPGETIKVRIALSEDARVELCADGKGGLIERKWMEKISENAKRRLYEADFTVFSDTERLSWFFCIHKGNEHPSYYSKRGLGRMVPPFGDRFIITPGVSYPEWVAHSNCYQILPDRFCNKETKLDYEDAEYSFDGAEVKALSFDEKPLPFAEGRCLDFYSGDLYGMADKLSYLKELGFNVIYTNPINSSLTLHRYDSIDFFHVDRHLGGDEAFMIFMMKAHAMGFKVIVDISINHTGIEHPWFKSAVNDPESPYAEFYYRNDDGSFRYWQGVPTLPQLNYNSSKLRETMYRGAESAMQKYLKVPYSIDGWRLDVAPEVARAEGDQLCHEVWREVRTSLKSVKEDCYIVGEAWDDSREYLKGDEWDGIMNYYGSGRPIRGWMGEEDRFLSTGWGHDPKAIKPFTSRETIDWLESGLNTVSDQRRYMMMNLFDSHDTPRLHNHKEIMDDDLYLGAVLALFSLPGMPNTYYGDEVKIAGEMGSVEMSRYPMEWNEEKQDKEYMKWWKKLAGMRALDGYAYSAVSFEEVTDTLFVIKRYAKDYSVFSFINRSEEEALYNISDFMAGDDTELLLGDLYLRGDIVMLPPRKSGAVLIR